MKSLIFILTLGAMLLTPCFLYANPYNGPAITEVSTDPDWIEVGSDCGFGEGMVIIEEDTFFIPENPPVSQAGYMVLDNNLFPGMDLPEEGGSFIFITPFSMAVTYTYGIGGMTPAPPPGYSMGAEFPGGSVEEARTLYFTPTPGDSNNYVYPRRGQTTVVLNEISVNSDCYNGEFIELYNRSGFPVDISGWRIVGNDVYTIPEGTVINDFHTLRQTDAPGFFGALNKSVDNIYLFDDAGVLLDQVGWSSDHGQNVSFMRYPDGNVSCYTGFNDSSSADFMDGFPTRNGSNRTSCPGFTVIGTDAVQIDQHVRIIWTDPLWRANYQSTKLIRSTDHFPQVIYDGRILYDGTEGEYLDSDISHNVTYYYSVFAYTDNQVYSMPGEESRDSITCTFVGIEDDENPVPLNSSLITCYPNPFNATTTIEFDVDRKAFVELSIYDLLGRKVATPLRGLKEAGSHSTIWNAKDQPSGIYFARLTANDILSTMKMVLVK